jgi:hypothetical protein
MNNKIKNKRRMNTVAFAVLRGNKILSIFFC